MVFINYLQRFKRWGGIVKWRTDRDSNPGDGHPPTHFPGVRLRPLGHLSVAGSYPNTAAGCKRITWFAGSIFIVHLNPTIGREAAMLGHHPSSKYMEHKCAFERCRSENHNAMLTPLYNISESIAAARAAPPASTGLNVLGWASSSTIAWAIWSGLLSE